MFDLASGRSQHLPRHAAAPMLASTVLQVVVVGTLLVLPLLYVTDQLPEARAVMVFVAAPPTPVPAPPPAPTPPARPAPEVAEAPPVAPPARSAAPAPVAPPDRIVEEAPSDALPNFDHVVVEGVPGGVPGGLVGTVAAAALPAPPPPPAPPTSPVRVGGNIDAPELLFSVQPTYPPLAVQANLEGVVILEAIVDRDGAVSDVTILRSVDRLLDVEAERAVRQWRYSPLVLNGRPERFVLTVTLSFHLDGNNGGSS